MTGNHDETRLREALSAAVPPAPSSDGRAKAVAARRRKSAQRRTAAVTGTAVVVAGVAVGMAALSPGGPDTTTAAQDDQGLAATSGPVQKPDAQVRGRAKKLDAQTRGRAKAPTTDVRAARRPQTREAMVAPCGEPPRISMVPAGQAQQVPADATAIWVCPAKVAGRVTARDLPRTAATWQMPALLKLLGEAPKARPDRCATVLPTIDPYVIRWARYDGSTGALPITSMCDDVLIDGRTIASNHFLEALDETVTERGGRDTSQGRSGPTTRGSGPGN